MKPLYTNAEILARLERLEQRVPDEKPKREPKKAKPAPKPVQKSVRKIVPTLDNVVSTSFDKKTPIRNAHKKGSIAKSDPIRTLEDIARVKELLADQPRNLALFVLGINTNLRACDLRKITVGQVRGLKPMDDFEIREQKTGKLRKVVLNKSCVDVLAPVIEGKKDHHYIFAGRHGTAITTEYMSGLVREWCLKAGLKGRFGTHTLRKTWGLMQRLHFGTDIPNLMVCYNHSNQRQTLDYLCISADETKAVFANEL